MAVVGILDSGVGGLSVARAVLDRMPDTTLLYYADTANFPYGERTPAEVSVLSARGVRRLADLEATCVVVACNTASACAPALERAAAVPVFEILSSATLPRALRCWAGARLGLIATPLTVASRAYHDLVGHFARPRAFAVRAVPRLVRLVEAGAEDSPAALDVVREELAPLARERLDALILGCTHFGFLVPLIQAVLGPSVGLIDPSRLVAEAAANVLTAAGLDGRAPAGGPGGHRLVVTGGRARRVAAAAARLGLRFQGYDLDGARGGNGAGRDHLRQAPGATRP